MGDIGTHFVPHHDSAASPSAQGPAWLPHGEEEEKEEKDKEKHGNSEGTCQRLTSPACIRPHQLLHRHWPGRVIKALITSFVFLFTFNTTDTAEIWNPYRTQDTIGSFTQTCYLLVSSHQRSLFKIPKFLGSLSCTTSAIRSVCQSTSERTKQRTRQTWLAMKREMILRRCRSFVPQFIGLHTPNLCSLRVPESGGAATSPMALAKHWVM